MREHDESNFLGFKVEYTHTDTGGLKLAPAYSSSKGIVLWDVLMDLQDGLGTAEIAAKHSVSMLLISRIAEQARDTYEGNKYIKTLKRYGK